MKSFILPLIGIVGSILLIKYRQQAGDMIGEAEWMRKVGGVYNVIILMSLFFFFWSLAEITGTTTFLFSWIPKLVPGMTPQSPSGI